MSIGNIPPIWITYAWADNAQGDFSYLVQELETVGVEAIYDRIAITPGQRLWDQIATRITQDPIDGWGYLLTSNSLASEPCREELAYALDRALNTKGGDFPLIGLLHGVRIADVPPALKVRLCVSLASPNWKEEIKAGLERRSPAILQASQTQYVWQVHQGYAGVSTSTAIEVRPRFGEVMYWRFAVPSTTSVSSELKRQADIYIFCVLNHKEKDSLDPLNLDQWEFYILRAAVLDEEFSTQKSIGLASLLKLNPCVARYDEIAECIGKLSGSA